MDNRELLLKKSAWMEDDHSPVVLSSRIRLARNLEDFPFPHLLSGEDALNVENKIARVLEKINVEGPLYYLPLSGLTEIEKQVLLEKHLVSPDFVGAQPNRGVALSIDHRISVMVNEEDHLRMQVLLPGNRLTEAYQLANLLDDALEAHLDFAFRETRGYLTACPTNVGTGMRASVMVHLPALAMTNQVQPVLGALTQIGLAVRGLYGEGSQAHGNIFQLSNQITLGKSEKDILTQLEAVTGQIVGHELKAREFLRNQASVVLEDKLWRTRGLLQNARLLTSEEAIQFLSLDRMGTDMEVLPPNKDGFITLFVNSRPGCIQYILEKELDPRQRDEERARLIRESMAPQGVQV